MYEEVVEHFPHVRRDPQSGRDSRSRKLGNLSANENVPAAMRIFDASELLASAAQVDRSHPYRMDQRRYSPAADLDRVRLERVAGLMNSAVSDCLVTGFESLTASANACQPRSLPHNEFGSAASHRFGRS